MSQLGHGEGFEELNGFLLLREPNRTALYSPWKMSIVMLQKGAQCTIDKLIDDTVL